jgi:large subunit ribosomal protein L23
MSVHATLIKPLVTEKGITKKENERTLCFQVSKDANKIQIKQAVKKLFGVDVEEVRTANFEGKLRRRGRFAAYRSDWKKAYVKIAEGQKVPEFTEM